MRATRPVGAQPLGPAVLGAGEPLVDAHELAPLFAPHGGALARLVPRVARARPLRHKGRLGVEPVEPRDERRVEEAALHRGGLERAGRLLAARLGLPRLSRAEGLLLRLLLYFSCFQLAYMKCEPWLQ